MTRRSRISEAPQPPAAVAGALVSLVRTLARLAAAGFVESGHDTRHKPAMQGGPTPRSAQHEDGSTIEARRDHDLR
jgi:hypothetical protein